MVADELIETAKEGIIGDFYLMFRPYCLIETIVADQLEDEITSELCECNLQQLVAYMVMHNTIGSMALPHSMLVNIADALDEEDADYDSLKESFLEDLNDFVNERSNMTINKGLFSQMIDVFIFYFR